MDVNVPLLRKTLDWAYEQHLLSLRGLPSEWNQGNWILRSFETSCGTACCIAGKVALELGWQPTSLLVGGGEVRRDGELDFTGEVAAAELGLDDDQADNLFASSNTIERLYFLAREFTGGEIEAPPDLDLSRAAEDRCFCGCGEVQF